MKDSKTIFHIFQTIMTAGVLQLYIKTWVEVIFFLLHTPNRKWPCTGVIPRFFLVYWCSWEQISYCVQAGQNDTI